MTYSSDLRPFFLCFFLPSVSKSRLRFGSLDVSESGGVTVPLVFGIAGDEALGLGVLGDLGDLGDLWVLPPLRVRWWCGVS